jgi:hypothetical protein
MPGNFVSINGTANDGSQHKVRLTVRLDDNTWQAGEPSGTSLIFATKKGVWMRAVNIVTLFREDAQNKVGQLSPLVPETVAVGDMGQGHSFETAVDFDWEVVA